MQTVAALFVDPTGVYSRISGVDCWDQARDARLYAGPHPVVAHPPCQLWGAFAAVNFKRWGGEHNRPGNDGGCFESAMGSIHRWGGILEHPANSRAWGKHGLDNPTGSGWSFSLAGWVCEVWQSAYGHLCRKRTWLYYVGSVVPCELNWSRSEGTHQIGFHDQRGKAANKPTVSGRAASATPPAFAEALIALARNSHCPTPGESRKPDAG